MSKYHNQKIHINGETFDSKKEYNRYVELLYMEKGHIITDLHRQVEFLLIPTQNICGETVRRAVYVADFTYRIGDKLVVEDVKGFKTDVYKLKRKLMKMIHDIDVREV